MSQPATARPEGVAIVTGAASGMGLAVARRFAAEDWTLLACDLDAARLDAAVEDGLEGVGVVETLAGDISAADFPARLLQALDGRPVAALVHCAGLSPTMGDPARILEVNLAASLRLVEAVRDRMAPRAAAVLFASTAGHMLGGQLDAMIDAVVTPEAVPSLVAYAPNPGAAYSISKRGVQLLVRRQAKAFGARQARIASISPGIIDTPMGQAELGATEVMRQMIDMGALPRMGRAEEVAAAAAFLCSPEASFITGCDLRVDGGQLAVAGVAP
jgi:NAD(P)-dependent dehydrogenase (short-subunit alcohol dehydrogenase family)